MITDVILTQGAALLATIQLNCTAPQIQVVDERPWPGAYFRTIEDQHHLDEALGRGERSLLR